MIKKLLKRIPSKIRESEMTQAEVATKIGMSRESLSNRFSGKTQLTVGELLEICELLEINPSDLLKEVE